MQPKAHLPSPNALPPAPGDSLKGGAGGPLDTAAPAPLATDGLPPAGQRRRLPTFRARSGLLIGIVVGSALTLIAHLVLNHLGEAAWRDYQQAAQERGFILNWDDLGGTFPDRSQNLLQAPVFALLHQPGATLSEKRDAWDAEWGPHPLVNDGFPWLRLAIPGMDWYVALTEPETVAATDATGDNSFFQGEAPKSASELPASTPASRTTWASFQTALLQAAGRPDSAPRGSLTEELRAALAPTQPWLDEIRQAASSRPEVQFTDPSQPAWEQTPLNTDYLYAVTATLYLDGQLALLEGHSERAFTNAASLFRLGSLPLHGFADFRVRLDGLSQALALAWQGLAEEKWSPQQLRALVLLCQGRQVADFARLATAYNAGFTSTVQHYFIDEKPIPSDFQPDLPTRIFLRWLVPDGALRWITLASGQRTEELLGFLRDKQTWVRPSDLETWRAQLSQDAGILNNLANNNGALLVATLSIVTYLQAQLDTVALTAALQAHRQHYGSFPDTLEELAADLLPQPPTDPLTGQPYPYQALAGGQQFRLAIARWTTADPAAADPATSSIAADAPGETAIPWAFTFPQ